METANAVGDGKLTNEELGVLTKRFFEIVRRIKEGTLEKGVALKALQMVIEGNAKEMIEPCRRRHRSDPILFKMLPPAERRKSHAPLRMRLERSRKRLYHEYFLFAKKLTLRGKRPVLLPEDIIALMWEAENIPNLSLDHGMTPVQAILDDPNPSEHDRAVVASTLQWLGTNNGKELLRRMVLTADIYI